jgi:pantetheine-phosphate adenylyltransferase
MKSKVIYPGTFDPMTNGHLDLVQRAAQLFQTVIVAVAKNPSKVTTFSVDERISLAKKVLVDLNNVQVVGFDGLLINCAKEYNARVILRGLRVISDFEYEFQLASMNRKMMPDLETLFLTPAEQYSFISSNLVREISSLGGDVAQFVPAVVSQALQTKFKHAIAG